MGLCGPAGDLAKKKIYPALFALYVEGHLPDDFSVFGYARSKMSDEEFRTYIRCYISLFLNSMPSQYHLDIGVPLSVGLLAFIGCCVSLILCQSSQSSGSVDCRTQI